MRPVANHLFVYGTLHPDRAPAEIAGVVSRFVFFASGTVRGHIHRFAHYPALRLDPQAQSVSGTIFTIPPDAWPARDAYEEFTAGYTPHALQQSLFQRELTTVLLSDGASLQCWIYTYARPFPV